jgi:hypothetical protein
VSFFQVLLIIQSYDTLQLGKCKLRAARPVKLNNIKDRRIRGNLKNCSINLKAQLDRRRRHMWFQLVACKLRATRPVKLNNIKDCHNRGRLVVVLGSLNNLEVHMFDERDVSVFV